LPESALGTVSGLRSPQVALPGCAITRHASGLSAFTNAKPGRPSCVFSVLHPC
jgi:hypothetical protein